MRAILERRYSPPAIWARKLGGFSAVLLVVSALSYRFGLLEIVPFFWLFGIAGCLALMGLILAVMGLSQIWGQGRVGLGAAVLGAFWSFLVIAPYAVSAYRMAAYPALTDISTDRLTPPQFEIAPDLRTEAMNPLGPLGEEALRRQAEAYPQVNGRRYRHTKEIVVEAVAALIAERKWELLAPLPRSDASDVLRIEAVARSFIFAFPSDVVIRIQERANATDVDMRSASRYGRHDMGDNALRIARFLDDLDARMEEPRSEP